MDRLSHVDAKGQARMVPVGSKEPQPRRARASGSISLTASTLERIAENQMKKGDVFTVAQIAGIQAAKRTAELIPLCHPLVLDSIDVSLEVTAKGVTVTGTVQSHGRTGVEMEALIGVSVALLTIYDMCKAVDKTMSIGEIRLIEKVKGDG